MMLSKNKNLWEEIFQKNMYLTMKLYFLIKTITGTIREKTRMNNG